MHDDDEITGQMVQAFSISALDIAGYISALPEPQRDICHAMVIRGESADSIAERLNVTAKTVVRRTRKALAPLAVQYDIRNAVKYLPASSSVIRIKSDGKVTAGATQTIRPHRGEAGATTQQEGAKGGRGRKGTTEELLTVRPLGK